MYEIEKKRFENIFYSIFIQNNLNKNILFKKYLIKIFLIKNIMFFLTLFKCFLNLIRFLIFLEKYFFFPTEVVSKSIIKLF